MKTREICSGCGRQFFVQEKEVDPIKRSYCQGCRNRGARRRKIRTKEIPTTILKDVMDLIWLEKKRPELLEKLRLKNRKGLNRENCINKVKVSG